MLHYAQFTKEIIMSEATTTEKQTAEEKFIRLANKRGEKFKHQCKLY